MVIKEITLYNFIPILLLSNIKTLHINLITGINLVLGTNGCGKSSFLNECNPLAIDNDCYLNDGYKELIIEYENVDYKITSKKVNNQIRNSFVRLHDNYPMNKSYTITAHNQCVNDIFGYTPLIHKILTGSIKFTKMTSTQKKDLLMDINPVDLNYALNKFNQLRSLLRDQEGVVKHLVKRQVDLNFSLNTLLENNIIDNRVELEDTLKTLLPFTTKETRNHHFIKNELSNSINELQSELLKWKKYKSLFVLHKEITSEELVRNQITILETELNNIQNRIIQLSQKEKDLSNIINNVTSSSKSIKDLQLEKQQLTLSIDNLNKNKLSLETNPEELKQIVTLLKGRVLSFLSNDRSTKVYTQERIKIVTQNYDQLLKERNELELKKLSVTTELKHIEQDDNNLECPRCQIKLTISGRDKSQELEKVKKNLELINIALSDNEITFKSYAQEHEEIGYYLELVNQLRLLKSTYNLPNDFWLNAPKLSEIIQSPNVFYTYIDQFIYKLNDLEILGKLREKLENVNRLLGVHSLFNQNMVNELNELKVEISSLMNNKIKLNEELNHYKSFLSNYKLYVNSYTKVKTIYEKVLNFINILIEIDIKNDAISRSNDIYKKISDTNEFLNKKSHLELLISETTKELEASKRKIELLKIATDTLSPTIGIIADQMRNFIESYIYEMNNLISSIWDYTLDIKSCAIENEELNYKFPFVINDKQVSDVNKASTGQGDIIDLAFILVLRAYLKIENFPLFLDETGNTFDEKHRFNFLNFLKSLFENEQCSQILMVNHFTAMHGSIANSSIIVLNDSNITKPTNSNLNVAITFNDI